MRFKSASLGAIGVERAGTGQPLKNWDQEILKSFGAYTDQLGYISGPNLVIEVDENDEIEQGYFRTPMIELNPDDYKYLVSNFSLFFPKNFKRVSLEFNSLDDLFL